MVSSSTSVLLSTTNRRPSTRSVFRFGSASFTGLIVAASNSGTAAAFADPATATCPQPGNPIASASPKLAAQMPNPRNRFVNHLTQVPQDRKPYTPIRTSNGIGMQLLTPL